MKNYIQAGIIAAFTLFYLPALSEEIRQLSWNDLVPKHLASKDLLANLTQEQKELVEWVVYTLEALPEREPETEAYYEEVDKAMPEVEAFGIDIDEVMAHRNEFRTAIVEELNGKLVRIPGYLLPLEMSGERITEFLLVPYMGACIHVPPPPPNQIVHVKVGRKGGYKSNKLFETIWVTGEISAKSMVKELFLADGSAGINIGYTMQSDRIEPYEK